MTSAKIFVGNLSYQVDENMLKSEFGAIGEVTDCFIPVDRMTNRKRGFGFVTMATPELAAQAIEQLNGKMIDGRAITCSEAKPMQPRNERPGNDGYRRF